MNRVAAANRNLEPSKNLKQQNQKKLAEKKETVLAPAGRRAGLWPAQRRRW